MEFRVYSLQGLRLLHGGLEFIGFRVQGLHGVFSSGFCLVLCLRVS